MDDDRFGIALMIAACLCFAALDATAKTLSLTYPTLLVVWARYVLHLAPLATFLTIRHGPRVWLPDRPVLQWVRSVLLLTSTTCNFMAVSHLQLTQTGSVLFAAPIIICALSGTILGEPVGLRRWAAVLVGFLGVLVIMRPDQGLAHPAILFSVASAIATALYQITTRRLVGIDRAEVAQLYTAIAGVVGLTPVSPVFLVVPAFEDLAIFAMLGLWGALGHWLLVMAHQRAPAARLAPFAYSQIIGMVSLGWLVFGDLPDGTTVAGAAIVIASGLYLMTVRQPDGARLEGGMKVTKSEDDALRR